MIGGPEKKTASEVLGVEVIRNHRQSFEKPKKFKLWLLKVLKGTLKEPLFRLK